MPGARDGGRDDGRAGARDGGRAGVPPGRPVDADEPLELALEPYDVARLSADLRPVLVPGEKAYLAFVLGPDAFVVLTDLRMMRLHVTGRAGGGHRVVSLPWARVRSFTVNTLGSSWVDLWLEERRKTRLSFDGPVDVDEVARVVGAGVLHRA